MASGVWGEGVPTRASPLFWCRFAALCFYLFRRLRVVSSFSFHLARSHTRWLPWFTLHYTLHPPAHACEQMVHTRTAPHKHTASRRSVPCFDQCSRAGLHQPCITQTYIYLTRVLHSFRYLFLEQILNLRFYCEGARWVEVHAALVITLTR